MAEYNIEEEVNEELLEIETTDVMTGDKDRNRFLYYQLKMSIQRAKKVDSIVSFLMESRIVKNHVLFLYGEKVKAYQRKGRGCSEGR